MFAVHVYFLFLYLENILIILLLYRIYFLKTTTKIIICTKLQYCTDIRNITHSMFYQIITFYQLQQFAFKTCQNSNL